MLIVRKGWKLKGLESWSRARLLLFAAVLCLGPLAAAQESESPETEETRPLETIQSEPEAVSRTDESPGDSDALRSSEDASEEPNPTPEVSYADPCEIWTGEKEPRLDQFRREVFETVCEAAQWFDGFFGSRRFDEEARRTNGRVGALLLYDEHDGVDFDGTLKVRVDFPNLEHRYNAFFGREDEQSFLSGTEDQLDFLPTFFEREGDQEWLLGLGYRPGGDDRSSLDFDVGIEAETPIDPYARARYRYLWPVGENSLVRARQTLYWTNQRDLGTATRIDYERPFWSRTLMRWSTSGTHDTETLGVDWNTGVTFYHGFTNDIAVSIFAGIDGETKRDVPIEYYGTRITYRQRMLREWFFGEVVTGVTWPKDVPGEPREAAWHLGFGFEIYFSGEDLRAGVGALGGDQDDQ